MGLIQKLLILKFKIFINELKNYFKLYYNTTMENKNSNNQNEIIINKITEIKCKCCDKIYTVISN